jgi:hypothetical protein
MLLDIKNQKVQNSLHALVAFTLILHLNTYLESNCAMIFCNDVNIEGFQSCHGEEMTVI